MSAVILAGIVALIISRLIKNKKCGKASCCGGCAKCPLSGTCHKKPDEGGIIH